MATKKNTKKAADKKAAGVKDKKTTKPKKSEAKKPPVKKADKKTTPAPARPSYDKSHKQVAHDILLKAAAPMNARQISDLMVSQGQISGKTPQATVGRDLCMNPDLFKKVSRGQYVAVKNNGGKALPEPCKTVKARQDKARGKNKKPPVNPPSKKIMPPAGRKQLADKKKAAKTPKTKQSTIAERATKAKAAMKAKATKGA